MSLTEWHSRRVAHTVGFVRAFVATFRSAHVPFLAGSIAYAAFVSLLPTLVLAVVVAGVVVGDAFVDTLVDLTEAYLSPAGQAFLATSLERATTRAGLSLFSLVVLVWAALRLVRSLDLAFSLLYGTSQNHDLGDQLVDGVVVLAAVAIAITGTVLVTRVLALFPAIPYSAAANVVLLVGFLTVTLFPLYYVFPDRSLSIGAVLPGTVVAAVGWTALEVSFDIYVGLSSAAELYGVIGGVILLVVWLYFGALVLLAGATVNVVVSAKADPRTIDPKSIPPRAP